MIKRYGRIAAAALALALTVGAPAAAQSYSDGYLFLKAVREKDADKVNQLVASSANVVLNIRDQADGEGALHYVTRDREIVWLNFLLGKGARADIQNSKGETPLSLATQIGWREGAELLLSRGASVDLGNQRGETPLMLAVQRRDLPMVQLLLSHGANPNKSDRVSGYSALEYAKRDPRATAMVKAMTEKMAPAKPAAGPRP
ncbi:MAG: ankyrin repeat domain-containing protein [Alphaproteobacteria bacterium]|nr:ankyrin repeat domain-containing protein [Alphaproteobacteria bacterium]